MTTPAGWYDDGSGRSRWWDGSQWTAHFADDQKAGPASQSIAKRFTTRLDGAAVEGTLWSAVGKPMTGIGAGRYRLTAEYLIFETGTLSTKSQQIKVHEIHDVDASQSLTQKARGVGNVTLWARRTSGDEKVVLEDIAEFREGVEVINRIADEARHRLQDRQNTQTVNYTRSPLPTTTTAAPAATDLNSEIERLAAFHAEGILDAEEFAAAKKKLLGL